MYKEAITAMHILNIVFQSIFNLIWQIALMLLLAYLSVRYLSWPTWVYAPFTVFGALTGIYSMIKFILSAQRTLDSIEKANKIDKKKKRITENNEANE